MKHLSCLVIGAALLAAGCQQGSSTAPSTNPNRPGDTRKLTVTSPGDQTVTQDRTDEMTISINRDNFSGPVAIELRNLPAGVELVTKDLTIPADKSSITVTIRANPTAAPADDHVVTVVAKAKEQADLPEATTTFKLDVKSK
jgi:ABC-type Fe3+-hydroxamate transport system substrate-binding protein